MTPPRGSGARSSCRPARRGPLDSADVDALSLQFHDRPVVLLGSDENDRARSRFDAAVDASTDAGPNE